MRVAADCNNTKACFPVAVIYLVGVGTTPRGFSDNFWIQMLRQRGWQEYESILSPTLEFFSSTNVYSFVAETIVRSLSGSFWKQLVDSRSFAHSKPELIDAYLKSSTLEPRTPRETSG